MISRVNSLVSENEKSLLEVIAKGMKKPVKEEIFDATAQNFPQYLNIGSYLDRAKILTQIPARDAIYYTSPKIFKLKREFNKVLEIRCSYYI
jgi:hypothetical protein